jgi:hypothetical protein
MHMRKGITVSRLACDELYMLAYRNLLKYVGREM